MNKTLMLVICDFLLLSMLALARFDPPEERPEPALDATASSATAEAELIALLEESLETELESRTQLAEDLSTTRQGLRETEQSLAEREAALAETERNLEETTAEAEELAAVKASLEAEKAALAKEKAEVDAAQSALAERFDTTRTELEKANTERVELATTLGQLKEESSVTKERLSQTEEQLVAREIALAEREAELKAAEEEATRLAAERERLNRELEVATAERTLLAQNLANEQAEKAVLQSEKEQAFARAERLGESVGTLGENVSQLGEGVATVAQTSEAIAKEIEAARPQTMSEIFTAFQNNRAAIRFRSVERGLFNARNERNYEAKSILISDTEGTYLVTHTADTPFSFSKTAALEDVSLEVELAGRSIPVNRVGFLSADPRLIFIPLPRRFVEGSGLKTFPLALRPERWEEAILIKNDESNFGRAGFRRITSSERFLKMDRPALGELFADFASSRGDLAFSQNARFLGVLTDTTHAVVVADFLAAGAIDLGDRFDPATTEATIARLKDRVAKLPAEVR